MPFRSHLKISIVTVVRNGEPFIRQTIESVRRQSYDNIEYIVIDGGSMDGTLEVIKSNEASITFWISEPDKGIADAFNKGLSKATGDYLLFLNADDALAADDVVENVVKLILTHEEPEILYGDCDLLDRASEEVLSRTSIKFMPRRMRYGHMIPQPSMFTRKSYFEKYGKFDAAFKIAMDYEWLLRGGMVERVLHIPLLVTRVHDGGVSTQSRDAVINEIVAALKKNALIRSAIGEFKLRSYFFARSMAKLMLKSVGLYKKHG